MVRLMAGVCFTLFFFVSASTSRAETTIPPIAAFENAVLGDAVAITDLEVALERFDLHLEKGVAAPLIVGGDPIGFYFMGKGTWSYVTTEPDERSAVVTNVKTFGGLRTREIENGLAIDGSLKHVLVWARGVTLPGLDGAAAPDLNEDYANHRKAFDVAEIIPASHLYAHQVADLPLAPMVRVEIRDNSNNLVYTHDGVESRAISLDRLRRMSFMLKPATTVPVPISWQPLAGGLRTFQEPVCLLTHMDIDLTAEGEDASLTVTSTIRARLRAQRIFRFDLEGEVYDRFRNPQPWTVTSVVDAEGTEVPFHQTRSELFVLLAKPASRDQPFTLRFEISGPGLVRFGGTDYWRLWTSAWYPRFGRAGTYTTVNATVRTKAPYIPIAGGKTVDRRQEGDYNVVTSRIDHPIQYYTITGGRYHIEELEQDGLTVRVATYALKNKRAMKKLLNLAHKLIDFYESWLGPFPFEEFQIVEADSLGWGQAPPGMMFITAEAFTPHFYKPWAKGINHRFAHEIAHQYWGHLIKWPSPQEQWLSESFADVSASFALKQVRGQDAFDDLFTAWTTNANETGGRASIAMANRIAWATERGSGDRVNLLYEKGPLVLFELRDKLGGKRFAQFMHGYVKTLSWRFTTTGEFVTLLNNATGEDYSDIFERYYWGTEMPNVKKPSK